MTTQNTIPVQPAFPWAYFLIAFGFSWLAWLPAVLASYGFITPPLPLDILTPLSILVGAFGPLVSALILTSREGGKVGRRQFLKRGLNFRIPLRWLAIIFGLPILVSAAARYLDILTGGTPPPYGYSSPLALLPTFIFILLLGGPIQEEYGWRGYALDRMQARFGSLKAGILLGAIWTLWHLPFWFMTNSGMEGTPLPIYTLYTISLSVVIAWVYNGTGKNVLVSILFHTMANFVSNLFPTHGPEVSDSRAYLILAVLYMVIAMFITLRSVRQNATMAELSLQYD